MTTLSWLGTLSIAALAALTGLPSEAVPVASNLSFTGQSARDVYGMVSGTDSLTKVNTATLSERWGGTTWIFAAKDNTAPADQDETGKTLGVNFTVQAGAAARIGNWILQGTNLSSATMQLDIIAVLKAGNGDARANVSCKTLLL